MLTRFLALGPRFGLILDDQQRLLCSRGSFWADFAIFEILGGAVDTNISPIMPIYCDGLNSDLGVSVT